MDDQNIATLTEQHHDNLERQHQQNLDWLTYGGFDRGDLELMGYIWCESECHYFYKRKGYHIILTEDAEISSIVLHLFKSDNDVIFFRASYELIESIIEHVKSCVI